MDLRSVKTLWTKARREARSRGSALLDQVLFGLGIAPGHVVKGGTGSYLLFVCEALPARAGRMAKWITRTDGSRIVLLCHRDGFVSAFKSEGFADVILFRNAWHLRRILRASSKPKLVHGFAPKSHYPNVARIALKGTPYIHDLQDTLAVYYGTAPHQRWLREELPHERACMAEADGLVAHSLEPNEGFRRYGIAHKDRPRTLFFPLYCDDDAFVTGVEKIDSEAIHLVYAGGIAGSHRDPKHYGNIQFFGLIDMLTAQGLHFHIYPSPTNIRADVEEYEALAKTNPRFHFHQPVAQEKLAGELARYHYGIHLGFVNDGEHQQSQAKYRLCTTLKLFNFIEAGIPVLSSDNLDFQSWIVTRHGAGFGLKREEVGRLGEKLRGLNYGALATSTGNGRAILSLKMNTPRLLRFYSDVLGSKR
ncbi:MAG TPA: glycosyltransferase [Flavobacteriales bacterium]|nr:glycosyltransferase [Flavobacteriales bacterium]